MTTSHMPTSITARVDASAIERVASFFPHTAVLPELLQNPRRAAATQVEIGIHEGEITISDNGIGIGNPEDLLGFGHSDWTDEKVRRENPAGMGIFSLARYPSVMIRSRSAGSQGWEVKLTPDVFRGRECAVVQRLSEDIPVGTTVAYRDDRTTLKDVADAARYYPLPVRLNGDLLEQREWLKDAVHVEEFEGVLIGVSLSSRYGRWRSEREPHINFHGIQPIGFSPVYISTLDGNVWDTRVDVQDCSGIELALPARREVIQNDFLDDLKLACLGAIYRAMARSKERISLSFADLTKAREMGFDLPEAEQLLTPWRPDEAHYEGYATQRKRDPVPADPICIVDVPPALQQTVFRSATRAGVADRFVDPDGALSGYGWYDAIPKVWEVVVFTTKGDSEREVEYSSVRELDAEVDSIRLSLRNGADAEVLSLPADIALLGEDVWLWDDADITMSSDCEISVEELVELLMAAYFDPSDDSGADSFDTQYEEWREGFTTQAMRLLLPAEEEMQKSLEEIARKHLAFVLQHGYCAELTLRYGQIPQVTITKEEGGGR